MQLKVKVGESCRVCEIGLEMLEVFPIFHNKYAALQHKVSTSHYVQLAYGVLNHMCMEKHPCKEVKAYDMYEIVELIY